MRIGIAYKINLIVLATVLSLGGILGAFFVVEQDRALRADLDRRVALLGRQLAGHLGHVLSEGREAGEAEAILRTVVDPEVAYLLVKRADGAVVAGRWSAEARSGVTEYEFPIYGARQDGHPEAPPESFGLIEVASDGVPTGTLAVGVDLLNLRAQHRRLIARISVVSIAAALVAMLVGVSFARLFLRRSLQPLLEGIRGVAGGDLGRRVGTLGRHDELAEIGQAFDHMTSRLASTLIGKGELEATVSQRTAQLSEALEAKGRVQEALADREERLRLLLDSTAEAIYGIGPEGLCTFANAACARLLGYGSPEALVGRNVHTLIHHSAAQGVPISESECRIYRTMREGKGYHSDQETFWKADGSSFPVEVWSFPMLREGATVGSVTTFLDLTERHRLEEEVLKSRKLESLGVLAGGIAHDFNNLLTGILGNLSLAREELQDPAEANELLREAEQASLRARNLTQQLLTFSRGGAPVKRVLALRPIVEEASRFALSGSSVRGQHHFAPDLWPVEADAGQVGQVIQNLVINAVQAMPGGGRILLETENAPLADGEVVPLPAGRYVRIRVSDDGPGIPGQHLTRIFDPYFTTKSAGHGLGLATVYSIAKRHGGHVTVRSTEGRGTSFDVYLPAAPAEASALPAPSEAVVPPPGTRGRGRVLVMDDEPAVLRVATSMLTRLGYDVEVASNGQAAIDRARAARDQGRPFDLLVMDLTVPGGMGGAEAIRRIREFDRGARCIATSGYSNDPVMASFQDFGFTGRLTKPYTLEDLDQAIGAARRVTAG